MNYFFFLRIYILICSFFIIYYKKRNSLKKKRKDNDIDKINKKISQQILEKQREDIKKYWLEHWLENRWYYFLPDDDFLEDEARTEKFEELKKLLKKLMESIVRNMITWKYGTIDRINNVWKRGSRKISAWVVLKNSKERELLELKEFVEIKGYCNLSESKWRLRKNNFEECSNQLKNF